MAVNLETSLRRFKSTDDATKRGQIQDTQKSVRPDPDRWRHNFFRFLKLRAKKSGNARQTISVFDANARRNRRTRTSLHRFRSAQKKLLPSKTTLGPSFLGEIARRDPTAKLARFAHASKNFYLLYCNVCFRFWRCPHRRGIQSHHIIVLRLHLMLAKLIHLENCNTRLL